MFALRVGFHHALCVILLLTACSPSVPPTYTPQAPTASVNGLIDVGGYRLYLHCEGAGSPTVILDAGLDATSEAWAKVLPRIGVLTRVCAYDRAGLGQSDPPLRTPRTSQDFAVDLHTLLANAHIAGPYVLAGWSIAGFNVRVYRHDYPDDVVGIVLVDATHPDWFTRVAAALPTPSPNESNEIFLARTDLHSVENNGEHMAIAASAEQATSTGTLGDLPLYVLTAMQPTGGELNTALANTWLELQDNYAALSTRSSHDVVLNVEHCIQCTAPDVVADAILHVLDQAGGITPAAPTLTLTWDLTAPSVGLDAPQGLAIDAQDRLYVIDSANNRVQVFDRDGVQVASIGTYGKGEGQFRFTQYAVGPQVVGAVPLAVDTQGQVFVADPLNHRIEKFSADGQFLAQWGTKGNADGQFQSPSGLAVDSQGHVFVSDLARGDIQKFDSNGQFLAVWGSKGDGPGELNRPGGLAVDAAGNVYVADFGNQRIQKFGNDGHWLLMWGVEGNAAAQLLDPISLAVNAKGDVYVLEASNFRIQKFDSNGLFLASWARYGTERFHSPIALAAAGKDRLFVADIVDDRVVALTIP